MRCNLLKLLVLIMLTIFFLPSFSFSKNVNNFSLFCQQSPEGGPFGLWFNNGKVTQIGVVNYIKVYDYNESYKINDNGIKWLNVRLNIKNLTLHIGQFEEHFAECQKTTSLDMLNKKLDQFIKSLMDNNTI